jgi:lysophospholipase L1-like esterase
MRRALVALLLAAAVLFALPSPARALTPLHVLAVGDSLTVDPGWRVEFSTLAAAAGVDAQFDVYAVRGWGTADALPGMAAVLVATKPDLVVIAIGTNDSAAGAGDVPGFEDRYQRLLGTILDASSAAVAPAWLAYSQPPASAALTVGEGMRNDAIFRCIAARGWLASPPAPRLAGIVDLQPISPSYFVADGIHLTAAGEAVMGRQVYRGVRASQGWPAIPDESPALTGHRP